MIELRFVKTDILPVSELVVCSELTRIPFTLRLTKSEMLPDTVYVRNFSGENLVEFRFDKDTGKLYEITMVSIDDDTIEQDEDYDAVLDQCYECLIVPQLELKISIPMQVRRARKSIGIVWGIACTKYYRISKECILGVDDQYNLGSVSLVNMREEDVYEVFGF